MKVSIITPVWNRSDLTYQWLSTNWQRYAAVFQAGHDVVEWIIIDNGSDDNTQDVLNHCKSLFGSYLKVVTLHENVGFSAGNNRGVEVATGDIYAFISNDVQVNGDYIMPIRDFFSQETGKILAGPEIWENNTGWNTFKESGIIPYIGGWCVAIKAENWDTLCRWDERYFPCDYEDVDLSYQAVKHGGQLRKIKLPLYHYSGKSAQAIPGGRQQVTLDSQAKFMAKWSLSFV